MPRIAQALQQVLIAYTQKKTIDRSIHNSQKNAFFVKIVTLVDADQLTLQTLIDTLSQSKNNSAAIFHKAGLWHKKPSLDSQAAQHVATLFRVLGYPIRDNTLQRIISGEIENIEESLKQQSFARISRDWQLAPYDSLARQRMEHELKGQLHLNNKDNCHRSLAEAFYEKYKELNEPQEKNNAESLIQDLSTLHKLQPLFFVETVFEITRKFENNARYMTLIINYLNENADNDENKQALQKALINSHPHIALHAILAGKNASHFYKLDSAMQNKVQQELFIAAREGEDVAQKNAKLCLEEIKRVADEKLSAFYPNQPEEEKKAALVAMAVKTIPTKKSNQFLESLEKKAVASIAAYLATRPNKAKRAFFSTLHTEITGKGISLEVLSTALAEVSEDELFYKRTGRNEKSGAAKCMAELYYLATGKKLTAKDLSALVHTKMFPSNPDSTLACYCTHVANGGPRLADKRFETVCSQALAEVRVLRHISTRINTEKRLKAEAQYQEALIKAGLEQAHKSITYDHRFDPQGHVILEVCLTDEDYQALYYSVTEERVPANSEEEISPEEAKKYLAELLTIDPSKPTYCNLDVKGHDELLKAYTIWATTTKEKPNRKLGSAVEAFIDSPSRSSTIALQEEMEMHMRLSSRVLQRIIPAAEISPEQWNAIHNEAAGMINTLVQAEFQSALIHSYNAKESTLDFSKLNYSLDKARADLAPECKKALINACRTVLDTENEKNKFNQIFAQRKTQLTKKLFKETPATALAYLRTDVDNNLAARISATDKTAHDKKIGAGEQAVRIAYLNIYNAFKGTVTPHSAVRALARVPSLAYQDFALIGNNHTESVRDTADKLRHNYTLLQKLLGGYQGPMTYNLLTSLHSKLWDRTVDHSNRQRSSAARIQKGAHCFNREQVLAGHLDSLWYVQNIAVNQHSNNLSYPGGIWGDGATAEATLMGEIALLHNFAQHAYFLPPALQEKVKQEYAKVHMEYVSFLKNNTQGRLYFKDSREGQAVIARLTAFKTYMVNNKDGLKECKTDTLTELAGKALIKMMSTNQHWDKQFGMLVQSLSVFTALVSLAGCKSANERLQLMAGRAYYLASLQDKPKDQYHKAEKALYRAFRNYINGSKNTAQLQQALDKAFNQHNVYGVATQYSEEDQGAPAKTQKSSNKDKGNLKMTEGNTNIAENGHVQFFYQKCASPLQPHKGNHAEKLMNAVYEDSDRPTATQR